MTDSKPKKPRAKPAMKTKTRATVASERVTAKRATKKGAVATKPAAAVKKGKAKPAATKPARAKRVVPPPTPVVDDATTRRREAAKKTALAVALAALDKKAERVEIVDIGEKVDYADFLVVMTGRSDRQVVAIAQGIESTLKTKGVRTHGHEGANQGHWVLLDVGDVIVHVFLDEARKYYDLEGLWMDAPRVPTPSFASGDGKA